jgi:energy-converting hydrogenase Eha subunit C
VKKIYQLFIDYLIIKLDNITCKGINTTLVLINTGVFWILIACFYFNAVIYSLFQLIFCQTKFATLSLIHTGVLWAFIACFYFNAIIYSLFQLIFCQMNFYFPYHKVITLFFSLFKTIYKISCVFNY